MRDRLIELILKTPPKVIAGGRANGRTYQTASNIADHLLANGVIVPPCKVGDTVYYLDVITDYDKCKGCEHYYEGGMGDSPSCNKGRCGNRSIECIEIKEVLVTQKELYWWLYMNDFGKTVFLTREEAEAKLKGEQ